MNAKLNRIDEKGQILLNDLKTGRIDEATYTARLKKLVDRAEAIMARRS